MVEVKKDPVDRIALTPENRARVDKWLNSLNQAFGGMIKVTRTDLVNSLLEVRAAELSDTELKKIAKYSFDEVRWLNFAVERLKDAKKTGQQLTMDQLLTERNTLLGDGNIASRGRPKGSKKDVEKSSEIASSKGEERV